MRATHRRLLIERAGRAFEQQVLDSVESIIESISNSVDEMEKIICVGICVELVLCSVGDNDVSPCKMKQEQ